MKNSVSVSTTVIILVISVLFIGNFSAGVSAEEATVEWDLEACEISVTASTSDVDFGTVNDSSGSLKTADNDAEYSGQPQVKVDSNCSFDLQVSPSSFELPSGHADIGNKDTAIGDFSIKGGNKTDISSGYQAFSGMSETKTVKSGGQASGTSVFNIDYEYEFDNKDIIGDYKVILSYTASSA
jgi:hypothetical protein